jgi:hypothetical protein
VEAGAVARLGIRAVVRYIHHIVIVDHRLQALAAL